MYKKKGILIRLKYDSIVFISDLLGNTFAPKTERIKMH